MAKQLKNNSKTKTKKSSKKKLPVIKLETDLTFDQLLAGMLEEDDTAKPKKKKTK
jgi:hypothetical protein